MIIVLKREATQETADEILERIEEKGLKPLYMPGSERVVLGALGDERVLAELGLDGHPMVELLKPILVALQARQPRDAPARHGRPLRQGHDRRHRLRRDRRPLRGRDGRAAARPAPTPSPQQAQSASAPAPTSRAPAPTPSRAMGPEGLKTLRKVGDELDLPVVTEVMDTADVDAVAEHADMLQIGARNMQNFALLKAVGKVGKPVLLKRGLAAKVEDLLLAAEYLLAAGNEQVILCERGIRTFETATRNTLDLNAVAYMKQKTHLPVLVDPSHGTGVRDLVDPDVAGRRRLRRRRHSGRGSR